MLKSQAMKHGTSSIVALGLVLLVGDARALSLIETPKAELHLQALAIAGYRLEIVDSDTADGPYIGAARLGGVGRLKGAGHVLVRTELRSGQATLLDAAAAWAPSSSFELKAGMFKTALSEEHLIGRPKLRFSGRALLVGRTTRRLAGVQALGRLVLGDIKLDGRIGVFDAGGAYDQGEKLAIGRVKLILPVGLSVHLGWAVPHQQHLDAAIVFDKHDWWVHLEGLVILDPTGYDEATIGSYLAVARRFGDLEPALAWDFVSEGGVGTHRLAAGLNVHIHKDTVMTRVGYDVRVSDDLPAVHGIYGEIQAAF